MVDFVRWWGACEGAVLPRWPREVSPSSPPPSPDRCRCSVRGCAQALARPSDGCDLKATRARPPAQRIGCDGVEHDDPSIGADCQAQALRRPLGTTSPFTQKKLRLDRCGPRHGDLGAGPRDHRHAHHPRQPGAYFLYARAHRSESAPVPKRRPAHRDRTAQSRRLRQAIHDLQTAQHGGRRRAAHRTDLGSSEGFAGDARGPILAQDPPGRDAPALERAPRRHEPRRAEAGARRVHPLVGRIAAGVSEALPGAAWNHRPRAGEIEV